MKSPGILGKGELRIHQKGKAVEDDGLSGQANRKAAILFECPQGTPWVAGTSPYRLSILVIPMTT